MISIEIYDWQPGAIAVRLIVLLREVCGMGLAQAKWTADAVFRKQPVVVDVPDADASSVVARLEQLRLKVRRVSPAGGNGSEIA